MAMLKTENLFQIFGIIFLLLTSIGLISFTSKFVFQLGRIPTVNMPQQIFDPDERLNISRICPFMANAYQTNFNLTVCFNKTMHYWYIPWVQFDVWRDFREVIEEKRRKRMKELNVTTELGDSEGANETKPENNTEDVSLMNETSASRKVKEEPSKVVCTILAALLIISSIAAFLEVFRDKCLTKGKASPRASKQRFSFVDAASNEAIVQSPEVQRQEACQSTAKVTQTLVHQTSLDRAISRLSSEVKAPFLRRSSVPSQMMPNSSGSSETTSFSQGQIYSSGFPKQMNAALNESPDMRRKSRHFIRRH